MERDEFKIKQMRKAASISGLIFKEILKSAVAGASLLEIDAVAERLSYQYDSKPAFKGFEGFPGSICFSVNDVVIHGIPTEYRLQDGDIVGLDFGLRYKKVYSDSGTTIPIGNVPKSTLNFLQISKKAMMDGIAQAKPGNTVGDISAAIQSTAEGAGYSVVKEAVGHGVGYDLHEYPNVPCFGKAGTGPKLYNGQTLAIEVMINEGSDEILMEEGDDWTIYTKDGKLSAFFEHTVIVSDKPEIITSW